MKETVVYRSEYLVAECPYCQHKSYMDIEDDIGEGFIGDGGRKLVCVSCHQTMLVVDN